MSEERESITLVPVELQQAIDRATGSLSSQQRYKLDQHHLRPWHRLAIYRALEVTTDGRGDQAQAWLAILTAKHVLPLWQRERPADELPIWCLLQAEDLLRGSVDSAVAHEVASNAWVELEQLGSDGTLPPWC